MTMIRTASKRTALVARIARPMQHEESRMVTRGSNLFRRSSSLATLAVAAACLSWATDATAACFSRTGQPRAVAGTTSGSRPVLFGAAAAQGQIPPGLSDSIVGLWRTTFRLDDGGVYDETFQVFHSGGTEMMISNGVPPVLGNVCVGVWRLDGPRTVKLRHTTWNWHEDGTLAGTFLMLVTITLDRQGQQYEGTWVADSFDLDGNPIPDLHAQGVVHGTRITVDGD